jgi:paraquat-inducible protein A
VRQQAAGGPAIDDAPAAAEAVACHSCGLLQRLPPLTRGSEARCGRCDQVLAARVAEPLDRPLALTFTAVVAFVIANTSPLMSLSVAGRDAATTLLGGAIEMWRQGSETTAVVVAFCAVVAPACYLALLLAVLIAVQRPGAPHWVAAFMRWADRLRPWSMNEVLFLGILVALTKIAQLATVVPGPGLFAVGTLVLLLPAITSTLDVREVWRRIEWVAPVRGAHVR